MGFPRSKGIDMLNRSKKLISQNRNSFTLTPFGTYPFLGCNNRRDWFAMVQLKLLASGMLFLTVDAVALVSARQWMPEPQRSIKSQVLS